MMAGWTIAWTNPALLAGALGLVVPYLVHLLTKRTPRTMVFPTVRFVKRAQARQSAFFRLRDPLLLLLRTGFIAFLVLAFVKPVWHAHGMAGAADREQASIALIDASLSMQCNGGLPFARAQQAAAKLLDHLDQDAVVNVIVANASPTSYLETPTRSTVPLKRDLLAATPTLERADMDAALGEAVRQLNAYPRHARTIYIVSDFQRTNWSAAKFSEVPEDIQIVFIPVGDASPSNVAITGITVRPRIPVVSETVEVAVAVANYGAANIEIPVSLQLSGINTEMSELQDESRLTTKTTSLAPGASGTVSFRFRASRMGSFEGTARIPDDALSADNARYFEMEVHKQVDVLLVSDAADEVRSGGHFMWRALNPFAESHDDTYRQRSSTIRPRLTRARDLDLSVDPPQVLVLDGAGQLPEKAIGQIVDYLSNGGSAIYFLSDVLDKGNLEAVAYSAGEKFVAPFLLGHFVDRRSTPETKGAIAEANFDDPVLRRFKDAREIAGLAFYRYFETERNQGRGEVLAKYDDGSIAIGKAFLGAGTVLLCNFSAGRDASDLAQNLAFVPLTYEMIKALRPRESTALSAVVGFPVSGSFPAHASSTGLLFLSPSGKSLSAATDRRGERLAVMLSATKECGFYRVNEGSRHLGSLAVNIDPRESDLTALTGAQLAELSASPERKIASTTSHDTRAVAALLEGVPLWPYLLFAALCLIAMEQAALVALRR